MEARTHILDPRRYAAAVAAFLMAVLLAALLVPASQTTVVFLLRAGDVLPQGARILEQLPVAGAVLVQGPSVPEGGARVDEPLGFRSLLDAGVVGAAMDSGVATVGADIVWANGNRGEGAVVALVDSGVAPVPALDGAVVGEIDFTGTGGGDPYGHGTFIASIVAGRHPRAPGVAPAAAILSLKVGRPDGSSDLGTVMGALQWLHGPGRAAGVRVATLALGVEPGTPAAAFLDAATLRLAEADVLLVTASGNEGPGRLSSPATSTGTFSIGAEDDRGTPSRDDDAVAPFSATGVDRGGAVQPDAYAPGVSVVGSMSPTALIYRDNPQAVVDGELFRGTGTSMATGMAAGVAALVQAARPDLGGSAIEVALRNDAGRIDALDAVATAYEAPSHPSSGQGNVPAVPPGLAKSKEHGNSSATVHPSAVRWTAVRWTAVRWTAVRWTAVRWTAVRWTAVRWTGRGWGDAGWQGALFGTVRWTGQDWAGDAFVGHDDPSFHAVRWTAVRWTAVRWTAVRWR